jgi:hypothetical protein
MSYPGLLQVSNADVTSPIYRTCSIEWHLAGVLLTAPVPVIAKCGVTGLLSFSFWLLLPTVSLVTPNTSLFLLVFFRNTRTLANALPGIMQP